MPQGCSRIDVVACRRMFSRGLMMRAHRWPPTGPWITEISSRTFEPIWQRPNPSRPLLLPRQRVEPPLEVERHPTYEKNREPSKKYRERRRLGNDKDVNSPSIGGDCVVMPRRDYGKFLIESQAPAEPVSWLCVARVELGDPVQGIHVKQVDCAGVGSAVVIPTITNCREVAKKIDGSGKIADGGSVARELAELCARGSVEEICRARARVPGVGSHDDGVSSD